MRRFVLSPRVMEGAQAPEGISSARFRDHLRDTFARQVLEHHRYIAFSCFWDARRRREDVQLYSCHK